MPFESAVKIILENRGDQTVMACGSVLPMDFAWDSHTMHFRALWRTDHELVADPRAVQDLPFLLARGKGKYVGSASFLMNPAPVPTPYGNWWGEGDEKVFIDQDSMPSIFGTGSEDYYNYSWSSPDIFDFPYCGQPRNDGPGNRGFVTNYRWHIFDCIPFTQCIRFTMELYSHERTPGLSYARIGYHYGRPGITDDHLAVMPEDLRPLSMPENWTPAMRMGAQHSVFFSAENRLKEKYPATLRTGALWEGGKLLVWNPSRPKERIEFVLEIANAGRKQIHLVLARTPRSGKMAFRLDGKIQLPDDKSETLDLYIPFRTLSRDFALPPQVLEPGLHTLVLEYRGASSGVEKAEIGIDFIWIQDAD